MKNELLIKTDKLSKDFGTVYAVRELDLSIPKGITYGLLGPNGAGKTTTVRMLNGLIKPTSGTGIVAGFNIKDQIKSVKSVCGFLPESPGLYEKLTAFEFLEFVGELYSVPKDILYNRIDELLSMFDLKGRENELLEEYSRGMKQKVCLCSTLIQDPQVIFLDEPTATNVTDSWKNQTKKIVPKYSVERAQPLGLTRSDMGN